MYLPLVTIFDTYDDSLLASFLDILCLCIENLWLKLTKGLKVYLLDIYEKKILNAWRNISTLNYAPIVQRRVLMICETTLSYE